MEFGKGQLQMAERTLPADLRPTESFEFQSHLIEKVSRMCVLVMFSAFNLDGCESCNQFRKANGTIPLRHHKGHRSNNRLV